ncbi:MAG: alternative ribosome rescue aminoacyl-tRNA hydrolase ArfB [Acidimicrobiales bacterium]
MSDHPPATAGDEPDDGGAHPDDLVVNATCRIPRRELVWRFGPSGGPGGQHANRAHTRAELRFDVEASSALTPRQRQRLVDRLGPVVRVVADEERSQQRNRDLARRRLRLRLAGALHESPRRRATRPSRSSVERRLTAKRRRGETKRGRRWRPEAD